MKFWDLVKIANRNLLRNKLRTILTVLAIFVGSFTLIMTNGISDGMRDFVDSQVKNFEGKNILMVRKKIDFSEDEEIDPTKPQEYKEQAEAKPANKFNPTDFLAPLNQVENLKQEIKDIETVTPRYDFNAEYISLDGIKKYQVMLGMLSQGVEQKVEAGQTISGVNEIVIPLTLAKTLNPEINQLIGKDATIGYKVGEGGEMRTIQLKIVGVATKGLFMNFSAFVDAQTARKIYEDQNNTAPNYNKFSNFTIQLSSNNPETVERVKKQLDEKGFSSETFDERDKRGSDGIIIIQAILGFFAFIALLAASFGIINTLVVAVMERTKEIGLQKALGMGRWKIFTLFTLESALIGFWGAMLGVVVGIIVGKTANFILSSTYMESFEGYNLFSFRLFSLAWVVILVCLIAFLAGVLPAYRASRLHPIEALRYE